MMKKYKWSLLLGSLLSLSPILIGLLLWNQLPAKLPTHFSTGNTPDGWSSKAITVCGLPLFMFAMMWFCFLFTHVDPKRQNISPKLIRIITLEDLDSRDMAIMFSICMKRLVRFLV